MLKEAALFICLFGYMFIYLFKRESGHFSEIPRFMITCGKNCIYSLMVSWTWHSSSNTVNLQNRTENRSLMWGNCIKTTGCLVYKVWQIINVSISKVWWGFRESSFHKLEGFRNLVIGISIEKILILGQVYWIHSLT